MTTHHSTHGENALKEAVLNPTPSPTKTIEKLIRSHSSFDSTPLEILHIILTYYTDNLKGLLRFSAINRTCQSISRSSLIWLTCELQFHAPIAFSSCVGLSSAAFFQSLHFHRPSDVHIQTLFREETEFPLRCIVIINRSPLPSAHSVDCNSQEVGETSRQYAERISSYVLRLNRQFQYYWLQQIKYYPILDRLKSVTKAIDSYYPCSMLLSNVLISIAMYFLDGVNYSALSENNRRGFQLLFATYLLLYFILINSTVLEACSSTIAPWRRTLKLELQIDEIGWKLALCLAGLGFLILLVLAYLRLIGQLTRIPSWVIVVIFSIFLFPALCLFMLWSLKELRGLELLIANGVIVLSALAIPISFLVLDLYYDHDHHCRQGIPSIGYAIVPWYPLFLVFMILTGLAVRFWLDKSYQFLIRWKDIGATHGRLFPRRTPQWLRNLCGFSYLWILLGSSMVASIVMVVLSVTSFTGEVWEVGGVRLTGTFLVLLMLNSLVLFAVVAPYDNVFIEL